MGHTEAELTCPAARWACLALAADEIQELFESGSVCAPVQDRVDTFNILRRGGVTVSSAAHQDCGPATEERELLPSSPVLLLHSLPRVGWENCAPAAEGCVCGHVA